MVASARKRGRRPRQGDASVKIDTLETAKKSGRILPAGCPGISPSLGGEGFIAAISAVSINKH